MRRIARVTGGQFYSVKNPKRLPQIYIKETRVVSRPLIFERTARQLGPLALPVAATPCC